MSKAVQRRFGTTAEHADFTGISGEFTYNTDTHALHTHDGVTAGGYRGGGYCIETGTPRAAHEKLDDFPHMDDFSSADDALAKAESAKRVLYLGSSTYTLDSYQLLYSGLSGMPSISTLKADTGADCVLKLGHIDTPSQWTKRRLSGLIIDGNLKASDGVRYESPASAEVAGRWTLQNITLSQCDKAIHKPLGNIGNTYIDVNIDYAEYGVYAVSSASPLMHAGNDTFIGCQFSNCAKAALYYDSDADGSGGVILQSNTIIQYNAGFGVYVKNYNAAYTPFTMDGVWFEGNATATNITVGGVMHSTVYDIYLEDTTQALLLNGIVPSVKLVNSHLKVHNCKIVDGVSSFVTDSTSVVEIEGAYADGGYVDAIVRSFSGISRTMGNFAVRCRAPHRTHEVYMSGVKKYAEAFDGAGPFAFGGSPGTVNATSVSDGLIHSTCAELALPTGYTVYATGGGWAPTVGSWHVTTLAIKLVSGGTTGLTVQPVLNQAACSNLATLLTTGVWVTLATISKATIADALAFYFNNSSGGTITLRIADAQCAYFSTEQQALDFYNNQGFLGT